MSAHTTFFPLPWSAKHIGITDGGIPVCEIRAATGPVVAEYVFGPDATLIIRAANAHDDLLAACNRALSVIGSLHSDGTDPYVMEAEASIRAAIAKAGSTT